MGPGTIIEAGAAGRWRLDAPLGPGRWRAAPLPAGSAGPVTLALETLDAEAGARRYPVDKALALGAEVGRLLAALASRAPPVAPTVSRATIVRGDDGLLALVVDAEGGDPGAAVAGLGAVLASLLPADVSAGVRDLVAALTDPDPTRRPTPDAIPALCARQRAALPAPPRVARSLLPLVLPKAPARRSRRHMVRLAIIATLLGAGLYVVATMASALLSPRDPPQATVISEPLAPRDASPAPDPRTVHVVHVHVAP